jgi:hypothetical protein
MLPENQPAWGRAVPALTKRSLDAADPQAAEYFMWCGSLAGFGARIYPTGRKVFVAQVRVGRKTRRIKIGSFGAFTVEQARERATAIIRAASDGRDPQREKQEAREAITVGELCEQYLEAARGGLVMTRFKRPKRASTLVIDEGRISRHIMPLIGSIRARDCGGPTYSAWLMRSRPVRRRACSRANGAVARWSPAVPAPQHASSNCSAASTHGRRSET